MNEQDFPPIYKSANRLAIRSQKYFMKVLLVHLILLVFAAVLSAVDTKSWWFAALQVLALLAALSCAIFLNAKHPDKTWYGARAVAESVKTVTWRYMCKAEPFNVDDEPAREELRQRLSQIVSQNREVSSQLNSNFRASIVTDRMIEVRASSAAKRKEVYAQERILDQLYWYEGKAKEAGNKASFFFWAVVIANAIAVVLAILKIRFPYLSHWPTDVFITASACFISWMQARRFSELSSSYALTAHEISIISDSAMLSKTEEQLSRFIGDAENAFSREHTQWVARKDEA